MNSEFRKEKHYYILTQNKVPMRFNGVAVWHPVELWQATFFKSLEDAESTAHKWNTKDKDNEGIPERFRWNLQIYPVAVSFWDDLVVEE